MKACDTARPLEEGFLQCNGGKLEKSVFFISVELESELLSNNSLFVGQL